MKYLMRLPEHSGSFIRELGGWGAYHTYLSKKEIANIKDGELVRIPNSNQKVGRNEPCPCGSGRKNKKCCQKRS